nr:response regulator [Paludisphaera mucosa]
MIVDDNRDAADLAVMLLTAEGLQAEAVYNGFDALRADKTFRPDVVLLDLGLPGMDGYQVAEALNREQPPPFVVAMSGYAEDQAGGAARASGCSRYLVKPVDIEAMLKLVRGAPARES